MGERPATASEREAILGAVSPFGPRGVASALIERDGALLDGAVVLETAEVFVRPLPTERGTELDAWIALLDRRRAQLAHDVSGPATGVLAALETVLEYEPIPESSRSILDDARRGMHRLSKMLGDRSSGLATRTEGDRTTIRRLVDPIAELHDPYRERLVCALEGDAIDDPVDAVLLEGVLYVLITNAWKFRGGPSVHVNIRAHRGMILSVEDDGKGADADAVRRAGELGHSTRASGVGLGLFLVRRALSRLRGGVCVEALERGFRTTVSIPDQR